MLKFLEPYRELYKPPPERGADAASRLLQRVQSEINRVQREVVDDGRLSPANSSHLGLLHVAANRLSDSVVRERLASPRYNYANAFKSALDRARKSNAQLTQEEWTRARNAVARDYRVRFRGLPSAQPPSTVFGNDAWIGLGPRGVTARGFLPRFRTPSIAIPCIQRVVRREIMFATRKAGRGYRVPHKFNRYSGVPC